MQRMKREDKTHFSVRLVDLKNKKSIFIENILEKMEIK